MRYPADNNIQINISNEGKNSGLYIAPLLTFSCIENAFKYGLRSSKEQFILLDIKTENNTFYFQLENDIEKNKPGHIRWRNRIGKYAETFGIIIS